MTQRPPWPVFRAALDEVGFRPSRRLGQNFLLDENMVRAIVRDARVGPGDRVVEIGAGCGFLSLHLLDAGVDLVSVEIDARLLEVARALVGPAPEAEGRLRFVHADALAGKHSLSPELEAALPAGRWHLVANLPYSISAPLLSILSWSERAPETMTVLVQREVGRRIAARPGTPDWGPLSIRLQAEFRPTIVRNVPAGLFWPRPEVESAVVRLEREPLRIDPLERDALSRLVSALFQRRRQTLGRVLAGVAGDRARAEAILADVGLDPRERAENLDLATLRALARVLP